MKKAFIFILCLFLVGSLRGNALLLNMNYSSEGIRIKPVAHEETVVEEIPDIPQEEIIEIVPEEPLEVGEDDNNIESSMEDEIIIEETIEPTEIIETEESSEESDIL